jgi:hypothetical protein
VADYPFAPSPTNGEKILVSAPTGLTAVDTPNVAAAIGRLNTAGGGATLQFQDGTYQLDSNSAVILNCTNFAVNGTSAMVLSQAPNRAGKVNNTTGNILTISGCSDFAVNGLTLDGLRDTLAPMSPLTATANSGQPSITIAAGQGARYLAGQFVAVFGGLAGADSNLSDGWSPGGGGTIPLVILSITPGGGSGGGDLITFTTNLANTYNQQNSTAYSDGFGPFAYQGDYLTSYQCGYNNVVAGRTLSSEDQQNGLHLINCTRFTVNDVEARNLWESPIKLGTGFEAANNSLTSSCTYGTVSNCNVYHAYDQGVSVWNSRYIVVKGCQANAAGWAGISLTASDLSSLLGNVCANSYYRAPTDNNSGSGIATEGGVQNQIKGNIIFNPWSDGIRLRCSPLGYGAYGTSAPTLTAFVAAQTAAGTSIAVSATGALVVNAPYSIIDGPRSEAVTLASIVDGTHITLTTATLYSHASGTWLGERIDQENVIEGNTIFGPQQGQGINVQQAVRQVIKHNSVRNWSLVSGTGSGITLSYSNSQLASTAFLGGDGSHLEGNTITGGLSPGITVAGIGNVLIRGNRISGLAGSSAAINLKGVTDAIITENYVSDIEAGQGIFLQNSTGTRTNAVARVTVSGNDITRCSNEGIIAQLGDSLTISNNVVSSCGGHAGINLRGITNTVVANNVSNANAADGILLEVSGATGCTNCRVMGNTCRDDGSGINVTTGAAQTQQNGIIESGAASNINLFVGNEVDANAVAQLTTVGAGSVTHYNIISGAISA